MSSDEHHVDLGLCRRAAQVNEDALMAAYFPEDTLAHIARLQEILLAAGRSSPSEKARAKHAESCCTITSKGKLIVDQACLAALPPQLSQLVRRLLDIRRRVESAVAEQQFERAVALRQERIALERQLARAGERLPVLPRHVDEALAQFGVAVPKSP